MNENDNILLEQFFKEAAAQQLEDDGFTQRVMQQLPGHTNWLSHLWTLFCVIVALGIFVLSQGWTTLASYAALFLTHVEVFVRTLPTLFDLSAIDLSGLMTQTSVWEILLSLAVLMVLSIIALTRWAIRWEW